ncbi:MAG TPA: hypothetical protein VMW55_02085 [Nitrosopumilaceae archaeon]|nr:hypothetical protein [Nitrosopumilaceae archaeon]
MTVQLTSTIEATRENIWKIIHAYDTVESWNPLVSSSKITGTDVEGGKKLHEKEVN